jgi:VanZ family protein
MTLVWAAVIFSLSTPKFNPDFTRGFLAGALQLLHLQVSRRTFDLLHTLLRKSAHLTEYGIFALILYSHPGEEGRRLWRPRAALLCVLGAAAYSLTDEFHQIFSPGRHASLLDCGLDTIGAGLAMVVPYARQQLSLLGSNKPLPQGSQLVDRSVTSEGKWDS